MRVFTKFFVLTLAVVAISLSGAYGQTAASGVSGDSIDRQVRKKINMLPYYEVFDYITYSVNGDTVTLSGKVRNGVNKSDAASAVKRIVGVSNVVNNIEVLPPGGFDESIRRNLLRSVANMGGLSRYLWPVNPSVRLVVDRGHVTLEGYVANQTDSDLARMAASTVSGVFSVTNNLVVDKNRAG